MVKEDRFISLPYLWIVIGLLLAFLTKEIGNAQGVIPVFDSSIEQFLFNIRTPSFLHFFALLTILGSTPFVIVAAGIIGIRLFFSKINRAYLAGIIPTLIGAAATGYCMKILVGRVRPGGLIPSTIESSFSFPSGHATASVAFYGFLMFILCELFPERKSMTLLGGTLFILGIGFSRLYLGVHFPSDVLAGYLLGGLWLLIGIYITHRMREKMIVQ